MISRRAIWKILRRLEEILSVGTYEPRRHCLEIYLWNWLWVFFFMLRTLSFFLLLNKKAILCIIYEKLKKKTVWLYSEKRYVIPRSDFRGKSGAMKLDDLLSLAHGNGICPTGAAAAAPSARFHQHTRDDGRWWLWFANTAPNYTGMVPVR